jgi:hypothetical protein
MVMSSFSSPARADFASAYTLLVMDQAFGNRKRGVIL